MTTPGIPYRSIRTELVSPADPGTRFPALPTTPCLLPCALETSPVTIWISSSSVSRPAMSSTLCMHSSSSAGVSACRTACSTTIFSSGSTSSSLRCTGSSCRSSFRFSCSGQIFRAVSVTISVSTRIPPQSLRQSDALPIHTPYSPFSMIQPVSFS